MAANSSLVARRYAQAVLELALEENNLDEWRSDLATLAQVWGETRISARLDDPKLGRTRRMDEARAALQGRVNPLALNLVLLLVDRGRAGADPADRGGVRPAGARARAPRHGARHLGDPVDRAASSNA